MEFSTEELDFFHDIFAPEKQEFSTNFGQHNLTVKNHTPPNILNMLNIDDAKATLLVEISHYQLWFPLALKLVDGEFSPK